MTRHLLRREVVFDWRWFRRRPGGQMGHHTAAVLNRDLALVVFKEDPVLIQLLDFAVNFPSWLISRMTFRWSVLRMICGSRLLPMDPPDTATEIAKAGASGCRLDGPRHGGPGGVGAHAQPGRG